jgi:hypothetical protein
MITSAQTPAALRCLIRNDEALLAHYGQWSGEHLAGHCASTPELREMEHVLDRLRHRRAALLSLSGSAATRESLAGSLVTLPAAEPALTLPTP